MVLLVHRVLVFEFVMRLSSRRTAKHSSSAIKFRKYLEPDKAITIENIHGSGYSLLCK